MTERMPIKEAKKKFIKRSFYCGLLALFVCWFMKLGGFELFEIDLTNKFFNDMDLFLDKYYLKDIFIVLSLTIQIYLLTCMTNKEDGKGIWLYSIKLIPLTIIARYLSVNIPKISFIIEIIYMTLAISKFKFRKIGKALLSNFFMIAYQIISLDTRSLNIKIHDCGFVACQILSIDLYILLYLHKEMEVNIMGNDSTWFFFGFTAWLYRVAGFIVGLFTFHPIKKSREWYEKGKAKEDARKAKKATK